MSAKETLPREPLADERDQDIPWSCAAESWTCPGGEILLLRVAGEIDLLTRPALHAVLDAAVDGARYRTALDRAVRHVVVDLAGVTFCCVRGFALLADTARAAAADRTGYAVSGLSPHLQRYSRILWAGRGPIRCYRSAAVAVTAIRVDLAMGQAT